MRLLFSFVGGNGHFQPLVPIARAAQAAGHEVAFACGHTMLAGVRAAGFTAFPLGKANPDPPRRVPLQAIDIPREEAKVRDKFAGQTARARIGAMIACCEQWQPDALVCDELDYGAMLAAETLQLGYASVLVIAEGTFTRAEVVAPALHAVRAEFNLPPDPALTMLSRTLVLSPFPPSYRHPSALLPKTAYSIRPQLDDMTGDGLPFALQPDLPTVYFTLGTVFNTESGDLFAHVLAALHPLPINAVVTTGAHIDPTEFGQQPAHVHIVPYIPQAAVLPHCDAVISHGGSGTVIGALGYGLPQVVIPMGADQPHNAARCDALGVGIALDPIDATPAHIRAAVLAVLDEPRYRAAAGQIRDEINALPDAAQAVRVLEATLRQRHKPKQ